MNGAFGLWHQEEILDIAGKIYKAGMSLLVIDTENKFISTGFAKEIARVAQGNEWMDMCACLMKLLLDLGCLI